MTEPVSPSTTENSSTILSYIRSSVDGLLSSFMPEVKTYLDTVAVEEVRKSSTEESTASIPVSTNEGARTDTQHINTTSTVNRGSEDEFGEVDESAEGPIQAPPQVEHNTINTSLPKASTTIIEDHEYDEFLTTDGKSDKLTEVDINSKDLE